MCARARAQGRCVPDRPHAQHGMFICLYVCTHIHIYTRTYRSKSCEYLTPQNQQLYIHASCKLHACKHTCIYAYIHAYIHTHYGLFRLGSFPVYICMYVYIHTYIQIKDAQNICVLEHGQIIEQGTHAELMRLKGLYALMASRQMQGAKNMGA